MCSDCYASFSAAKGAALAGAGQKDSGSNAHPAEAPGGSLKKTNTSKIALAVGAATILWTLIKIITWVIRSTKTADMRPWLAAALFSFVPWAAAGIALTIRSLRGTVRWPRALATWVGGFLVGAPGLIIAASLSGGRGDTTQWVLNVIFTVLFLVVGIVLLRVGFKR